MKTRPTAGAKRCRKPPRQDTSQSPEALSAVSEPRLDLAAERTMTVMQAALRLGKSDGAIRKWLRTGRLKGWQVGGTYCAVLVSEAAVEEVLRQVKRFGS